MVKKQRKIACAPSSTDISQRVSADCGIGILLLLSFGDEVRQILKTAADKLEGKTYGWQKNRLADGMPVSDITLILRKRPVAYDGQVRSRQKKADWTGTTLTDWDC